MWRHIAQSVEGDRHSAEGVPCQDCWRVRVLGDDADSVLVACVADGAGISAHSDVGSRLACESILASAEAHYHRNQTFAGLDQATVTEWCEVARRRISDCADQNQHEVRDYATTLCAAIIWRGGSVFFQVGDGAIVVQRAGALGVVFWPQSGEYVNTTHFLTSREFRDHLEVVQVDHGFSDVALLTDGMERLALKFDSRTPHPPFFQPLFRAVREAGDTKGLAEELRQLLQSETVRNKNDDDKTLVLASCIGDDLHAPD